MSKILSLNLHNTYIIEQTICHIDNNIKGAVSRFKAETSKTKKEQFNDNHFFHPAPFLLHPQNDDHLSEAATQEII